MKTLNPYAIVTISQGERSRVYTWAALGFKMGAKNAKLPEISNALATVGYYVDEAGINFSTTGELSEHHIN